MVLELVRRLAAAPAGGALPARGDSRGVNKRVEEEEDDDSSEMGGGGGGGGIEYEDV